MFSPLLFEGTPIFVISFMLVLPEGNRVYMNLHYYPCSKFSCSLFIRVTNLHHSSRRACLGLHRCGRLCLWNLQSSDSCHSLECHRCTGRKTRKKPKWLKLREISSLRYESALISSKALWYSQWQTGLWRVVAVIQDPTQPELCPTAVT